MSCLRNTWLDDERQTPDGGGALSGQTKSQGYGNKMSEESEEELPVGWRPPEKKASDDAWQFFYANLNFYPSVEFGNWPGISEPPSPETYSIADIYGRGEARYNEATLSLCKLYHETFRRSVADEDYVLALDWHHPSYQFYPHSNFNYQSEEDWSVLAAPNGDYYIFKTRDLKNWCFGHPWEQSICIFGDRFTEAFDNLKPAGLDKKLRSGGAPII